MPQEGPRVTADTEPAIAVTDAPDPADCALIAEGLRAYNDEKNACRDARPLAVLVRDPADGAVVGGLYGRSYLGIMFIDRFFLPEGLRGGGIGSRVLALAEAEGRRRGCARIALFTLHFQAPGFYLKQGYTLAAQLDCPPPGATRMLMTKALA
jgi:GNAT superfamily N-acetyltransferase